MIKLRKYQLAGVNNIRNFFRKGGKHVILQSPTGSGKTVMFSYMTKHAIDKGNKVCIFTDRTELLLQANGSIKNFGINTFTIQAGQKYYSTNYGCYIAMSQTFRRRIDLEYWQKLLHEIDLIIIDECHKQEFNYLFKSGLLKDKFVIGFTATPKRSGKMRQLALDYEGIISTISVKKLIKQGYLVNDDFFGVAAPDVSDVAYNHAKGDYQTKSLYQKFNTAELYDGLIDNYNKICPGTKTLIFCVNIEHVIRTCLIFNRAGYSARFITSSITEPKKPLNVSDKGKMALYNERLLTYELYKKYFPIYSGSRKQIFDDFAANKFKILINADIATTGYDCPDIETIIVNRATTSLTLWLQMLGRGSRISPGKTHFNILDMGGNAARLGYYSEERKWFVWHEESKGQGLPPMKNCGYKQNGQPIAKGGCKRLILAAYKICPFCGFKYPDKKLAKKVELESLYQRNGQTIRNKSIKEMNYNELYAYWKIKGHKSAWLWRQLYNRGGERAIENFGKKNKWRISTIQTAKNYAKNICGNTRR